MTSGSIARSGNRHAGTRPALVLAFAPAEFRVLQVNTPGPSGKLGGYQAMENWLIAWTDRLTLRCVLPPARLERLIRYCQRYGRGGPNGRIRRACIPALARLGIIVKRLPDAE